jgi:hypothetical protein
METFTMSRKEVPRAGLVKAALAGTITNAEGARALRLSVRQFRRLKKRFGDGGARSLLHRLRGRTGNRRLTAAVRDQITTLMTTTYLGFNDIHLTEKLREGHALTVSRASVRRLRRALGRPATRPRAAPQHRSRRPRKAALGQLAQLDASPFAWFEARGPMASLHGLIDDATSIPLALWFRPNEDLHGYVTVLDRTCRTYGVPVELYGDRLNLFQRNDAHWTLAEELEGQQAPTHFGRMLVTLGIGFIQAHSPQAKGRIERLFHTFQDRLIKEMRLAGVCTVDAANEFLEQVFLPFWEQRFTVVARRPQDAHRRLGREQRLERILSVREPRSVAGDYTVSWQGQRWGLRREQVCAGLRGARVEMERRLDGSHWLRFRGRYLPLGHCPAAAPSSVSPSGLRPPGLTDTKRTTPKPTHIPPPNHPWRTFLLGRKPDISTLR